MLRLCFLYREGGYYLDGDNALRKYFPKISDLPGDVVLFKWDIDNNLNICNWFMAAKPGSPCMKHIMETIWEETRAACLISSDRALRRILGTSGPVAVTNAFVEYFKQFPDGDVACRKELQLYAVSFAYNFVMYGTEVLGTERIEYKETPDHWLVAGKNLPDY